MKNTLRNCYLGVCVLILLGLASCHKSQDYPITPIVGHWGCEQYISCRVDSLDVEKWDTLCYEVGPGLGYEVYFHADGSGRLLLNASPALFKKFNCSYSYDTVNQILTFYNTSWILSMYSDETSADMVIEQITDSSIVASWTNHFSEPKPFFERFFMKRID